MNDTLIKKYLNYAGRAYCGHFQSKKDFLMIYRTLFYAMQRPLLIFLMKIYLLNLELPPRFGPHSNLGRSQRQFSIFPSTVSLPR